MRRWQLPGGFGCVELPGLSARVLLPPRLERTPALRCRYLPKRTWSNKCGCVSNFCCWVIYIGRKSVVHAVPTRLFRGFCCFSCLHAVPRGSFVPLDRALQSHVTQDHTFRTLADRMHRNVWAWLQAFILRVEVHCPYHVHPFYPRTRAQEGQPILSTPSLDRHQ
jgi:hypothetical protein